MFDQLHGKEISYNNLLDIDSAVNLIDEFDELTFAILKHNNACGIASRGNVVDAWKDVVGPVITRYTTNLFIKNQVLYVSLSSSVIRQELMMGREMLIRNLNAQVGSQVIVNIVFR